VTTSADVMRASPISTRLGATRHIDASIVAMRRVWRYLCARGPLRRCALRGIPLALGMQRHHWARRAPAARVDAAGDSSPRSSGASDAGTTDGRQDGACIPDGQAHVTTAEFLAELPGAMCARLVRCNMMQADAGPDCVTAAKYSLRDALRVLPDAGASGRVSVDSCGARACIRAFAASACDPASSNALSGNERAHPPPGRQLALLQR